jgi:hypothetical protein
MSLVIQGVNVYLTDCGSGFPILFLHGAPDSAEMWSGVIEHLKDQHRCLALPRIWCCFLACDVVKTRIFSICNIQRKTYFLMNILENGRYSCLPPLFAMWERSCEASLSSF